MSSSRKEEPSPLHADEADHEPQPEENDSGWEALRQAKRSDQELSGAAHSEEGHEELELKQFSAWNYAALRRPALIALGAIAALALVFGAVRLIQEPFGEPCDDALDCRSGLCVGQQLFFASASRIEGGSCSLSCQVSEDCPQSHQCATLSNTRACVPAPSVPIGGQCDASYQCLEDGECLTVRLPLDPYSSLGLSTKQTGTCHEKGALEANDKAQREHEEARRKLQQQLDAIMQSDPSDPGDEAVSP